MEIKIKESRKFAVDGIRVRAFKKDEVVDDLDDKNALRMVELEMACEVGKEAPAPEAKAEVIEPEAKAIPKPEPLEKSGRKGKKHK